MPVQGWFRDPYGIHEDRYFSQDSATRLVRDHGAESYDDPPPWVPVEPLVPLPSSPGDDHPDPRRADDDNRRYRTFDPDKPGSNVCDKLTARSFWIYPVRKRLD
jgi:hypothetical protein